MSLSNDNPLMVADAIESALATLVTVMVASLAGVKPPRAVPSIFILSPIAYCMPSFSIASII